MPGKDDRAPAPVSSSGQTRGGSANDLSRGTDGSHAASQTLPGGREGERAAHSEDGRTALRKQAVGGAADSSRRPFEPPAILRAPSSLLSRPLFLHPIPPLRVPFHEQSIPPPVPAPLVQPQPSLAASVDAAAPIAQIPELPQPTQPPAEVLLPKVELGVTPSAGDAATTAAESPSSAGAIPATASSAATPASASASTASAPDISSIAFATEQTVAPSLIDSSFASPGSADILPVTQPGVGVGGKVAAACVISAVFLLLLNWAFWLLIRRRRRARRSLPAHWDFAAPPARAKAVAGRDSEDAFSHSDDELPARDTKGGMVTVPI